MANVPITLACGDFARVMLLSTGAVQPEGIDLTFITSQPAVAEDRIAVMTRVMNDPGVHGGEASMAAHLRRIDSGDRRFIALPVFVLRNFVARDLYVRAGGPIRSVADLPGKRVGMYNWVASGSIWYRHFLRHVGVSPASIAWWIGDTNAPLVSEHQVSLPDGVHSVPEGRFMAQMLLDGSLDAVFSWQRPTGYHPVNGPIVRLFSDIRAVDRDYFRHTGVFPPQHLVVLRRDVWERAPFSARALTDAFIRANDLFTRGQRMFPYAAPWLELELEETAEVMGENFHPHGLEANRAVIEKFCRQAHALGITSRLISVEEYFEDYLL